MKEPHRRVENADSGLSSSALPEGLDTTSGETGASFRRGGAPRCPRPALLKDAPIYVLDEPTEGLDQATADAMMKAVAEGLQGRTLIVISHREQDFSIVDRIVRMKLNR